MGKKYTKKRSFDTAKFLRGALPALALAVLVFSYTPPGVQLWQTLSEAAGLAHFTQALSEDELHIHVIDVGKADAILLESPQAAVLVDCGTAAEAETVLRYLSARGVEKLDAVWISHPDSDHIGGLFEILESIPADCLVESGAAGALPQTELPAGCMIAQAEPGQTYSYRDMTLEVLAPLERYDGTNDNSVVFRLTYGDFSMLFCGDIEEKAERNLLESGAALQSDVLKVAHHGSATSTSSAFLEAVRPQYAVISTGEDRNHLPRNTVLKRLADMNVDFYRTDRDGSIVISTDGNQIRILTENEETNPQGGIP